MDSKRTAQYYPLPCLIGQYKLDAVAVQLLHRGEIPETNKLAN